MPYILVYDGKWLLVIRRGKQKGAEMRRLIFLLALGIIECTNPSTPAGYVGYVTKHPYTMPVRFYELQTGPTSTGLGWKLEVTNISVTPITSTEEFTGANAVLAKDNLHIEFRAHLNLENRTAKRQSVGREIQRNRRLPGADGI